MQTIQFFPTPQSPTDLVSRGLNLCPLLSSNGDTISSCTITEATNTLTITDVVVLNGYITCNVTGGISGTNYLLDFDVLFGSGLQQSFFAYLVVS